MRATSPDEQAPVRPPTGSLWNLPNTITLLRVAVVPILLLFPAMAGERTGSELMAWLFIFAAVTDLVDGWLARRGAQVTRIGVLLDPLADKLLVATALIMLLVAGRIPEWGAPMVVVIIGRELAVTGLRGLAGVEGVVMAAAWPGKVKAGGRRCSNTASGGDGTEFVPPIYVARKSTMIKSCCNQLCLFTWSNTNNL